MTVDPKEVRRLELARVALKFPELTQRYAEERKKLTEAEKSEAKRAERAHTKLKEQRKALALIATERSIAAKAGKRLKAEFVDPDLIKAESAAAQAVWQAKQVLKQASDDLRSIRSNIRGLTKREVDAETIKREEDRASQFEMTVARAQNAVGEAEKLHAPTVDAISAAWDKAHEIETVGA